MRACITGWLIVGLILAGLSYISQPYLNNCRLSETDNAFAHEYAGEMAARLDEMSAEAAALPRERPADAVDYFLAGEEDFCRHKEAAVYMKGRLAEDFVYAFAWAEAWCYFAARAADRPAGSGDSARAVDALARAKKEFRGIQAKDYRQAGR